MTIHDRCRVRQLHAVTTLSMSKLDSAAHHESKNTGSQESEKNELKRALLVLDWDLLFASQSACCISKLGVEKSKGDVGVA